MTWLFLFLALPGSALWPYNWPYSERYRWAKTCPGHRTAACGRSSPRAGTSAHVAVSAREGALPLPGSGEVFAGELARRLGPRLHRLGHDVDRRVRARAAKRQPAAVMPVVNAAPTNGASISATHRLAEFTASDFARSQVLPWPEPRGTPAGAEDDSSAGRSPKSCAGRRPGMVAQRS